MSPLGFILPTLYFCISIWCMFLARKGLKTGKLIFKKGTKGTGLENSEFLFKTQIVSTLILCVTLFVFGLAYAYILFQKF
jgi:hypothetical protein